MIGRISSEDLATSLALVTGLALVVLVRVWVPYDDVFRNGDVVLAANDPYFFRYWVEGLLATDASPFDMGDLAGLSEEIRTHRNVLFIVSVWAATETLGGSAHTAGVMLAWYPVGAAVVMAVLLYVLVVDVTGDRRIGLIAVVLLGLTPAHAYRTMLGFGDHDAFHALWVVVTAAALVRLTRAGTGDRPWRRTGYWITVGTLGVGVAALSFAWLGGPILLVPIAVFALGTAVSCVRHGRSPVLENGGLLAALLVASVLSLALHRGLNWAEPYRGFAPVLLFVLVVGILVVGELAGRMELPWPVVLSGALGVIGVWFAAIWTGIGAFAAPMHRFVAYFRQFPREPEYRIGETVSLVADLQTPVVLFGLLLFVAVPVMVLVVFELRSAHRPEWLAVSAYAWTFLALSIVQLRFTGVFSVFVAAFAAVGILYVVGEREPSWGLSLGVDRAEVSRDTQGFDVVDGVRMAGIVLVLVVLVTGIGVAQIPGTMGQLTVDDTTHETATWMGEYSADRGWEFPENYVFSAWGTNRVYNHVVSGEAESYRYAQQNYRTFVSSSDPERWHDDLEGRAGFVVVEDTRFAYPPESMQVRLNDRYGSAGGGVDGLAHYRLLYVSDDETTKVFTLVPGGTIAGNATPNTTLQVESDVEVGDTTFTYQRIVRVPSDGRYEVTVPYPGRYTVGSEAVRVSESNVTNGETIHADRFPHEDDP
ncbi:STT3 domain-containing protein [Natronorarus salvus]|uniref:STT3 domain-containing protein n=1 Tax=Natronorarus salvus TaxID=3117733 RepID=UPI002F26001B